MMYITSWEFVIWRSNKNNVVSESNEKKKSNQNWLVCIRSSISTVVNEMLSPIMHIICENDKHEFQLSIELSGLKQFHFVWLFFFHFLSPVWPIFFMFKQMYLYFIFFIHHHCDLWSHAYYDFRLLETNNKPLNANEATFVQFISEFPNRFFFYYYSIDE